MNRGPQKTDNPNGKTSLLTSSRLAISLFSAATAISSSGSKHIDSRGVLARPHIEGGKEDIFVYSGGEEDIFVYSGGRGRHIRIFVFTHPPPLPHLIELATVL